MCPWVHVYASVYVMHTLEGPGGSVPFRALSGESGAIIWHFVLDQLGNLAFVFCLNNQGNPEKKTNLMKRYRGQITQEETANND